MKRICCVFTTVLILGILIGYFSRSMMCIVFSVTVITVIAMVLYRKYKYSYILILPVLIVIGCIRIMVFLYPSDDIFEKAVLDDEEVTVFAVVYEIGSEYDTKYTFFAETEMLLYEDKKSEKHIGIKVTVDNEKRFNIGDKVELSGKLYSLSSLRNPGGFDEKLYYKTRNIEYKMYPKTANKVGEENNLKIFLGKLNTDISNVYDNILPEQEASLIKAMVAGDRSDLSDYTKDLFSNAGVYHIIAISGLHIHILSYIVLFFSEKIHKRYGKILAALFVILYCIFTGAGVSAVRAVCMFLIYIFGKFIYRENDILNSLAVSCFIILFFRPLYLFDPGFQYSFCAVLSIIIFSGPIAEFLNKRISKSGSEILSSAISVNFISRAVMWFHFYGFNVIDIFANLIILPFAGIVIFFGFVSGIFGLFSLSLAKFFAAPVYLILKMYEFVCELIYDIPFTYVSLGKPNIVALVSYLLIVLFFALCLYKFIRRKFFVFSTFFVVFLFVIFGWTNDRMKIMMLDVGQGDCFVCNYGDECFVIDGGGSYDRNLGDDTGVNVLFPYLKYMGIDEVSAVFVTHFDSDHVKGIIEILDCVNVKTIYISNEEEENDLYKILCEKALEKNVNMYKIRGDDVIDFYGGISIDCIYPFNDSEVEGNESSLVLKVVFGNNSFLFTGDIDEECEKKIINSGKNINADVLKLAHHGSKYSNCDEFIDKVSPKLAVVSAGNFSIYGQPAKSVVEKFEERNIEVLNTNEKGAVEIYSDGNSIFYRCMK